jgi:hypothetical protein
MKNNQRTFGECKITKRKLHAGDIEIAVAQEFNYRQNIIVPNVSYGLGFQYELDILIVTKAGLMYEVEIKVSKQDLKADWKKAHHHDSPRIKGLWFAVPDYLEKEALELIPKRAGLLSIYQSDWGPCLVRRVKYPKFNSKAPKITDKQRVKLGELAAMKIWSLKKHLYRKK